ncbi:hypothetical protein PPTG_14443 [Plasmopara halstedii]|uniref:HTH CENPB-type domain-containing protein n=1 Tax=Plasmopara halstedii TaxID=4781 RepID=A0A0P1AS12_PLAHL|nr:hypothetical protein PPTG_14443 [Plasmopara halstedii]CEG44436.1 hypothetical protein PPTG_14443 [Plasmopara halstedii]|eukprot:XP_024580805.1 hypothetical protein PPTG_14443 [Plasmopara halstedii]
MVAKPHQLRFPGGGRKPVSSTMEDLLYDEIINKRLKKEKVTKTWISDMGAAIYASLREDDILQERFAASQHWVANFMARYGLSLRRRTNLTVLTDEVVIERAVSNMRFLQEQRPHNYQDWFVAQHDVYGTLFRESYKTDGNSSVDGCFQP